MSGSGEIIGRPGGSRREGGGEDWGELPQANTLLFLLKSCVVLMAQ